MEQIKLEFSVIIGWTKDDIMTTINDVGFNGYYIQATSKNMGFYSHQCIIG